MTKKNCSFKPVVSPYALKKPINWIEQFGRSAPIDVEIGFGMGEVLMRLAQENPGRNYVGIEQHWERIYKTLRAIMLQQSVDFDKLDNIRILKVDARIVFERLFPPKSIDTIYCLFPCPWPKKSHIKHRLFTNDFLRLLNNRLSRDGMLKIVTDFYPYYEWVLQQSEHTGFNVEPKTIEPRYGTKFERKWLDEGQKKFFELNFIKKRHIVVPVKEDCILKNYVLEEFNPRFFQFENVIGDISVIFKDMVTDNDRQKVMIHVLVAEEYMTQHLWVRIVSKQGHWRITRAEGQNFFPTPGIAKALELVYRAAKKTAPMKHEIKASEFDYKQTV